MYRLAHDFAPDLGDAHVLKPFLDLTHVAIGQWSRMRGIARLRPVRERERLVDDDEPLKLVETERVAEFRRRAKGNGGVSQDRQNPPALVFDRCVEPRRRAPARLLG
jgi:hypothetical protein